jgi:hypothetical protein
MEDIFAVSAWQTLKVQDNLQEETEILARLSEVEWRGNRLALTPYAP